MRYLLLMIAVLAGSSCAPGVQRPAGFPAAAPPPAARFAGDGALALAKAGQADAPTYEQALALFGAPDVSTREGRGGLLSYRLPGCALALAFAMDGAGALRLAAVEAGPTTPRDGVPSLETCAALASARRNAGANS